MGYQLMEEQPEKTEVVIDRLFREMESTVTAYGTGAIQIEAERIRIGAERFVDGTSFFPAGIGLWRGDKPHGPAPEYFPQSPIMILGHNWGRARALAVAHRLGWDGRPDGSFGPTWRCLRGYLKAAKHLKADKVDETDCFFTNVFVGLQPRHAVGGMAVTEEFESQCRAFLCKQIEIVKPRLVAILGQDAAPQYRLSGCPTPSVELVHPYFACAGFNAGSCESIVAREGAKLGAALNGLDHK
jgi:hypothetical protein